MSQSKERILELNARLAQNLTDKGVEAMADETTTALVDKVAEISGGDANDFIGIKYLEYSNVNPSYNLPTVADARSLEKVLIDANSRQHVMSYVFYNSAPNLNGGYFAKLKEVFLPNNITRLPSTFYNCTKLTTINGDLTKVTILYATFTNCLSLLEIPYMPVLDNLGNSSFQGCTGLTSITFYKVLTVWQSNALTGCTNITTINLADGWNTAVYAQHCPKLTQASLHDMIEKYADMTGQTSPVMNVGSENIDKIDEEHKAMATAKNVTLA